MEFWPFACFTDARLTGNPTGHDWRCRGRATWVTAIARRLRASLASRTEFSISSGLPDSTGASRGSVKSGTLNFTGHLWLHLGAFSSRGRIRTGMRVCCVPLLKPQLAESGSVWDAGSRPPRIERTRTLPRARSASSTRAHAQASGRDDRRADPVMPKSPHRRSRRHCLVMAP